MKLDKKKRGLMALSLGLIGAGFVLMRSRTASAASLSLNEPQPSGVAPLPRQPAARPVASAPPVAPAAAVVRNPAAVQALYRNAVQSGNADLMRANANVIESLGDAVTARDLRARAASAAGLAGVTGPGGTAPVSREQRLEAIRRAGFASTDAAFVRQQAHILEMEGDVLGASQLRVRADDLEKPLHDFKF